MMANIERLARNPEGQIVPRGDRTMDEEYDALADEFIGVEANRDRLAEQLREAVEALREARSALKRRMHTDAVLDEPFDEGMAAALRRIDGVLGGQ